MVRDWRLTTILTWWSYLKFACLLLQSDFVFRNALDRSVAKAIWGLFHVISQYLTASAVRCRRRN